MKKLINDGWMFAKLPIGSTPADTENAVFTPVDLPHDWLIWQADDLYESSDAWYMRELEIEHETALPVSILSFDGHSFVYDGLVLEDEGHAKKTFTYYYMPYNEVWGNNLFVAHVLCDSGTSAI